MNTCNTRIAVVDSGLGGLSIWQSIVRELPLESTLFIGDNGFAPYSNKSQAFIKERMKKLLQYISSQDIKLVVIACNTATVAGIDYYRSLLPDTPIIGVVPVIKTAAAITKSRHIAVIATEFTTKSDYLTELIKAFAPPPTTVTRLGCTQLVEMIEKGDMNERNIDMVLNTCMKQVMQTNMDVVVIGCTHFAYIRDNIQRVVGKHVSILDSSEAVARHVSRILQKTMMISTSKKTNHRFLTTGDQNQVSRVVSMLLNKNLKFSHIDIY